MCALSEKIIMIEDVYESDIFDFKWMKVFDEVNNYHSQSMLLIPLHDHEQTRIGVMQLIKKQLLDNVASYSQKDSYLVKFFAAQAAVMMNHNNLIDDLEGLLLSFLEALATALGQKSHYGYDHIERVAYLSELLSEKISHDTLYYPNKSRQLFQKPNSLNVKCNPKMYHHAEQICTSWQLKKLQLKFKYNICVGLIRELRILNIDQYFQATYSVVNTTHKHLKLSSRFQATYSVVHKKYV